MKPVTERDLRMPEFRDAKPEDLEIRDDGNLVRKDRWETGLRNIASIIGWTRRAYEIPEVVDAVRQRFSATFTTDIDRCRIIDELILSWRDKGESPEHRERRIQARLAVEAAWAVISTSNPDSDDRP